MEDSPDGKAIRARLELYSAEFSQVRAELILDMRARKSRQYWTDINPLSPWQYVEEPKELSTELELLKKLGYGAYKLALEDSVEGRDLLALLENYGAEIALDRAECILRRRWLLRRHENAPAICVIIHCPSCSQKLRLPFDRVILAKCRNCGHTFPYPV